MSLAPCSFWRTVSGLACIQKQRRSHWEMRLMPKPGFARLSCRMVWVTGAGSLARPGSVCRE
jgi:hypothetical protein